MTTFNPVDVPRPEDYGKKVKEAPRSAPIEVNPQMPASELGKQFLDRHLREVTPTHIPTQDILTNIGVENFDIAPFHGGTIVFAKDFSWVSMSCPSEEAIQHKQPNQDRAGLLQLEDGRILFIQADGVGQSVDAQNASGYAVRQIIENGTADMTSNLEVVGKLMNKAHLMHEPAEDLPELVKLARNETKKTQGSNTTINQYRINFEKGQITTRILGDGNINRIKVDNNIERSVVGGHQQRLTTRRGIEQTAGEIGIVLQPGDVVLLTSDGLADLTNEQIIDLKDLCVKGDKEQFMRKLEEIILTLHDDDRTMFMYLHKR